MLHANNYKYLADNTHLLCKRKADSLFDLFGYNQTSKYFDCFKISHTAVAKFKPVKQEVSCTVIRPPNKISVAKTFLLSPPPILRFIKGM